MWPLQRGLASKLSSRNEGRAQAAGTRYEVTSQKGTNKRLLGSEEGQSTSRVCSGAAGEHPWSRTTVGPPPAHSSHFELIDLLWLWANYKNDYALRVADYPPILRISSKSIPLAPFLVQAHRRSPGWLPQPPNWAPCFYSCPLIVCSPHSGQRDLFS